jgi:hypothetical protein
MVVAAVPSSIVLSAFRPGFSLPGAYEGDSRLNSMAEFRQSDSYSYYLSSRSGRMRTAGSGKLTKIASFDLKSETVDSEG